MQIKNTVKYHFIPIRMAIIKNKQTNTTTYKKIKKTTSVGEDMEKLEPCALLVIINVKA